MRQYERCNKQSGHPGVTWRAKIGKWHARITIGGKTVLIGNFTDLAEAIAAREHAERELYERLTTPLNPQV